MAIAETTSTFGRIIYHGGDFLIDAEPFVMSRCRSMFTGGSGGPKGQHTHQTLRLSITEDVGKDLLWLMDRYPLKASADSLKTLNRLADQYDRAMEAAKLGDSNRLFELGHESYKMAEPPREHQVGFYNLAQKVRRILLGDDIGLGKTISGITLLCEPTARPALICVPTHLAQQWAKQIARFLPDASVHIIKGTKPYPLPSVDVIITTYNRLQGWQDIIVPLKRKTVIFDEVQDLRHVGTEKRKVARALSEAALFCVGLSATPIYNYGAEIWSVMDVVRPNSLGGKEEFSREWCYGDRVKDPAILHSYLKRRGLMLRRTKADLGTVSEPVQRDVITLDGDLHSLAEIQDIARTLALSVLSNEVTESAISAKELDWRLRQATGVAKASATAAFVKMLVESGKKVFLIGWHRQVYEIWKKSFNQWNIPWVMYTGTESTTQKAAAVSGFVEGNAKVFICSLRSGAGLDGLQHVCSVAVFGELDWSPQVMSQVIGRLDREGQTETVQAYFLTINDGADPFMIELLGDKTSQHDGIVDGLQSSAQLLEGGGRSDRIRQMAEGYLVSLGEAIPNPEPVVGLHAEVAAALHRLKLPSNTEKEMQEALWEVLPGMLPGAHVEREVTITKRSRLDFVTTRGNECIAIECKIDQTGKGSVYQQVRRYIEEADITGLILLAPWSGVASFKVDGVPVTVVDWSKAALRAG